MVHPEYGTKVRGQPFLVREAHVGVCDACGAEHFAAEETARWLQLFEEEQAKRQLGAEDIKRLREDLQLSMAQFAALAGCTRQSLHNWERVDRKRPQSRMADLMLKLVRESHSVGQVDVIKFLRSQASQVGITIPAPETFGWKPRILKTHRMPVLESTAGVTQLAADTESEGQIGLVDAQTNRRVGALSYDFTTATLTIEFTTKPELRRFDANIHFLDGHTETAFSVEVKERRAALLKGRYSAEEVAELAILPPSETEEAGQ
jgi:DNA-binding transcriptional regulator YiaG